jgi:hypothetical protein
MTINTNHVTNLLDLDGESVDLLNIKSTVSTHETNIEDINSGLEIYTASINQGRLTLTSNTPVLTSNTTSNTLFYTPYKGNRISLYENGRWNIYTFSQISLDVSALTNDIIYDIFIWNNNGTLQLEAVAWANSGIGTSARAVALSWLNGVRVKSTDNRKYLGSFNKIASGIDFQPLIVIASGGTVLTQRVYLVNEFNRIRINAMYQDSTSHSYTTASWRVWRNNLSAAIILLSIDEFDTVQRIDIGGGTVNQFLSISTATSSLDGYYSSAAGSRIGGLGTSGGSSTLAMNASAIADMQKVIGMNRYYFMQLGSLNGEANSLKALINMEY